MERKEKFFFFAKKEECKKSMIFLFAAMCVDLEAKIFVHCVVLFFFFFETNIYRYKNKIVSGGALFGNSKIRKTCAENYDKENKKKKTITIKKESME